MYNVTNYFLKSYMAVTPCEAQQQNVSSPERPAMASPRLPLRPLKETLPRLLGQPQPCFASLFLTM